MEAQAAQGETRIVLVDDHETTLMGMRVMLAKLEGFKIVGMARNGAELLRLMGELERAPELVTIDLSIGPGLSGYELCEVVRRSWPATAVVIYTASEGRPVVHQATQAGATAIVSKGEDFRELIRAVRTAARGERYISPVFLNDAVEQRGLSDRQREVLQLLANGASTDEVATHLGIARESVRTHVRAILRNLRAADRTEAVAIGLRNALIR